jgi:hypothetical protein
LDGLKNRGSSLAQKIYGSCQPNQGGFTQEVFTQLKTLINLLDEAFGTKKSETEMKLKAFVSDTNSDKKAALIIARQFKNQASDAQNCVETALEKLKTPSENKLEEARTKLKDLLANLKINGQDAYPLVSAEISNSETDLNRARQLYEKLREADEASSDNSGELLDALNNFKNDTNNQKAWSALNKYKRANQSQGFADEMLKKLTDLAQQRKKTHESLQKAKTPAEFLAAKTEFIKKPEYREEKDDFDQIYFPLLAKAAEIREKGPSANSEEKNLTELMTVILSDYSD